MATTCAAREPFQEENEGRSEPRKACGQGGGGEAGEEGDEASDAPDWVLEGHHQGARRGGGLAKQAAIEPAAAAAGSADGAGHAECAGGCGARCSTAKGTCLNAICNHQMCLLGTPIYGLGGAVQE